ncbi:MAG: Mfa1 family fimbria major subunit [Tannerellaceae bacterium]|nr:Mfa1 family fimbria major subunit [Tannerellaceae bacterium]
MKQMIKFFAATTAVAISMTACTNEEIAPDVQPTIERASLTIAINNEGTTTRANGDDNATAAEVEVKTVSVFVFGTTGTKAEVDTLFETTGAGGIDVALKDQGKYNVTINAVPVGNKRIYVGVNLPTGTENIHDLIADNGVNAAIIALSDTAKLAKLYTPATGFAMFSDAIATPYEVKQGQTNEVSVAVKRFVAKVTAQTNAAFEANTNSARTVNGAEIGAALTFAMGQINTKFFPLPQLVSGKYQDPNYSAASGEAIPYAADFTNAFSDFTTSSWPATEALLTNGFVSVSNNTDAATLTNLKPLYVLENTSVNHLEGEITFALVKAKFTPEYTHTYTAGDAAPAATANSSNTITDLYVFGHDGGVFYYFQNKTQADLYSTASSRTYIHYKDCTCFYNVFLDPNPNAPAAQKTYNVLRNDYYKLTIEKVNRLGDADHKVDNPTGQKGGEAALKVNIEVKKWNLIPQPVVLE